MKDFLPVLLSHVFLFVDDDPSEVGGVNFSRVLLSNLFIALLPQEVTLSQQFLHVSLWIRNNIRYQSISSCCAEGMISNAHTFI